MRGSSTKSPSAPASLEPKGSSRFVQLPSGALHAGGSGSLPVHARLMLLLLSGSGGIASLGFGARTVGGASSAGAKCQACDGLRRAARPACRFLAMSRVALRIGDADGSGAGAAMAPPSPAAATADSGILTDEVQCLASMWLGCGTNELLGGVADTTQLQSFEKPSLRVRARSEREQRSRGN